MEDEQIIALYFDRSQEAISQTDAKYGPFCRQLAGRLLGNTEDTEECVNDTYLALWDAIPPAKPKPFSAYIAKVTRNLAMKRLEYRNAAKRDGEASVSFEELSACLESPGGLEELLDEKALRESIAEFLKHQNRESRNIFLRRYFFFDSVREIANRYSLTESKVKSRLMRTRTKLRVHLIEEGFIHDR